MTYFLDVGDYPSSHGYFVYTTSDSVPKPIGEALEDFTVFAGLNISSMLRKFSDVMSRATAGPPLNPVQVNEDAMDLDTPLSVEASEEEDELESGDENEDGYESYNEEEDYGFLPHAHTSVGTNDQPSSRVVHDTSTVSEFNARIRADLRAAKSAGFRVGYLGSLLNHGRDCFVTVSCRIAKLGISDEALQAWHLNKEQYLVLIIHYMAGYRSMDQLVGEDPSYNRLNIEMRVGTSQKYKISLQEALDVFSQIKSKEHQEFKVIAEELTKESTAQGAEDSLHDFFISRPLNDLLNIRLLALLKYRIAMGMPWDGAEAFYNDHQGRNIDGYDAMDSRYHDAEDCTYIGNLPSLVTSDQLSDSSVLKVSLLSFPLVAMQFTLRHLVRCTEFCLVCHCKVHADFEALKPYVCDKPLCLYQYLNLGFGPSVEHEILSQPDVVDLLVNFCYASASTGRLKSFPYGLGLMVPAPSLMPSRPIHQSYPRSSSTRYGSESSSQPISNPSSSTTHKARFDQQTSELIFQHGDKPLKVGDWVIMSIPGKTEKHHRRIIEVLYPVVRVGSSIPMLRTSGEEQRISSNAVDPLSLTPAPTPPPCIQSDSSLHPEAEIIIYDVLIDDVSESSQMSSICMLLDTLPPVRLMQNFLRSGGKSNRSLRQWTDRIPPSALGILRWIIASNRSCIIQGNNLEEGSRRGEDRVKGMKGYLQFRFAQGAPDKEQRFVTAVRETTARLGKLDRSQSIIIICRNWLRFCSLDLKYPTMFAWHGSPLQNWHGIVREGLHFKEQLHGRAFGNGVYHSLDLQTSLGYTQAYASYNDVSMPGIGWPHSHLKISQALSLNEIVNAPQEFVSKTPHLVVSQLDWIQTRYLFVKCNNPEMTVDEKEPAEVFEQDPTYNPVGLAREKIVIPITAVSKSRRPATKTHKNGNKRSKIESSNEADDEIFLSDGTDAEDAEILLSDSEFGAPPYNLASVRGKEDSSGGLAQKIHFDHSKTDFIPGELDHSTLPILASPSYATSHATRALQRELKSMLKAQETQPAHELGWYLDPELVSNVYQWIVELHSFETHLPLAKDLKDSGLKSIILELRFGKDFPYSPPFVRVIRPRFLPFLHGGGGHVTAGKSRVNFHIPFAFVGCLRYIGGALCMELLTNTGWNPASSIESVLLQVRLAISSTEPRPARLERSHAKDYGTGEALEAFRRACLTHGVSSSNLAYE